MTEHATSELALLDRPEILAFLFHPRPETGPIGGDGYEEFTIPVDGNVELGGRWYESGKDKPVLLFFHGNGEIVADYHDLAPVYLEMEINFVPVDYRGYGRSTGSPTVAGMMSDAHVVHDFIAEKMQRDGYSGPLVVMGRSLGSASVLELASSHPDRVAGLIIESGFAHSGPLLRLLGVDIDALGVSSDALGQTRKIAAFQGPTLIIHGSQDHIIPFSDGSDLLEASMSPRKKLLRIDGADHNNLLAVDAPSYLGAVKELMGSL